MTRNALIITNPGDPSDEEFYCEGVFKDAENYTDYLTSPIGGYWSSQEITHLNQPTESKLMEWLKALKTSDYLIVIFCGHGAHSEMTQSTWIELKPGTLIDSDNLRLHSGRQLLILDCCRESHEEILLESFATKSASARSEITASECRKYFDQAIMNCPAELIVLNSCSVGQRAADSSESGGIYSFNLIESSKNWARNLNIDTSKKCSTRSVVVAHESSAEIVTKKRGTRQTATIEKTRTGPYFPFCIVA